MLSVAILFNKTRFMSCLSLKKLFLLKTLVSFVKASVV